jgi:predicted kinase
VVVDLAFLHMDMEHLGHSRWSRAFLAAYVNAANDSELYALLDFYATYRAIVRLKVSCLRLQEVENAHDQKTLIEEARLYMDQAYRYAIQFGRPTLWVFCGLPATGKSSLARQVAKALSISLFESDRVRKEGQADIQEEIVPFGQGLYRTGMRHRVYARLLALAQETLKGGHSVILDATFSHGRWRDDARQLAADLDTNVLFVESVCKEETIRSRLMEREISSCLSDARLQHFPQMLEDFEPLTELTPEVHLKINTDQPLHDSLSETLSAGHARKCAQVERLLQL